VIFEGKLLFASESSTFASLARLMNVDREFGEKLWASAGILLLYALITAITATKTPSIHNCADIAI
jgi:hypothetical protein